MKSTLYIASLLLLAMPALAGPRYAVGVDGLACPFCAYGLEKRLLKDSTVQKVETDIANSRIVVEVQDAATFTEQRARAAVRDAGFTLRDFSALTE